MSSTRPATVRALAVYTVLRVALFAVVWGVIWFLTPLDAVWSAVAAILISGAISLVLLDRQRGRVGAAAGGFFSRLNARIDAASRAEDVDEPWMAEQQGAVPAVEELPAEGSGEGQESAEDKAVEEK
ncbi:MAG: DUF4229 domain-containing protein [Candidatus Nanopelagicales bacterium]|nr:DUF4229 domain-containing protein [Candidatus Nanopelagicales bacterium]MCF8538518.1 DUF4229 domain-containing protein [Candidatus Nanopelagicales bacterium]MCF8555942.1 DUF4229 domain-containing protein [Candidatus Nanopelagicales bacterium]